MTSGSAPPSSGQDSPPTGSKSTEPNNQRNSPSLEDQLNSNAQVRQNEVYSAHKIINLVDAEVLIIAHKSAVNILNDVTA